MACGASLVAQLKESTWCRRSQFDSWVEKIPWRRDRLPTLAFLGFPDGSDGKELPAMWETWVQSPGWDEPWGGGHGNPLQYSCLENPHGHRGLVGYSPWDHKETDMTEWLSTAQWLIGSPGEGKSTHSSILTWRVLWTVWSVGLQRVRHDWVTFTFTMACDLGQTI